MGLKRHSTLEHEAERRHCYTDKDVSKGEVFIINSQPWRVVWTDHLVEEVQYKKDMEEWGHWYSPPFKKRDIDDKIGPKFVAEKSFWWTEFWDDGFIWEYWYNAEEDAYYLEVNHMEHMSSGKTVKMKRDGEIPVIGIDIQDAGNIDANAYKLMEEFDV